MPETILPTQDNPTGDPSKVRVSYPGNTSNPDIPKTADNAYVPRVTPQSSGGNPPAFPTSPTDIYKATGVTPPLTTDEAYAKLVDKAGNLITSTQASYNREIEKSSNAASANLAASGLSGSSIAPGAMNEAVAPIIEQREKDLATIYDNIEKNSITLAQDSRSQASADVSTVQAAQARAMATAGDSIKAFASAHLDWNNYKQTNPQNYNSLVQALGGDPNVADSLFAMSAPPQTVTNQYNVSDGKGGTTVNQIVQDPVTGAIRHVTYDLPGTTVPPNYQWNKIGTNSGYYAPSDFSTNPDPSKLIFVSSDPTNSQAITVTQNGITTVNGIPINDNPSPTTAAGGGTATAGAAPVVASLIGVQDPTVPLSAVIGNVNIGLDGVVNGIIANEGGSPKGVINNPGNIKFVGASGQKDSGVKATDGGTFASYDTKQDGLKAIGTLVQSAADKGQTFQDFINRYTNTGTTSSKAVQNLPWSVNDASQPPAGIAGNTPDRTTGRTPNNIWQSAITLALDESATPQKFLGGLGGNSGQGKALKNALANKSDALITGAGVDKPTLQAEFAANSKEIGTQVDFLNTVQRALNGAEQGANLTQKLFADKGINPNDSTFKNTTLNNATKQFGDSGDIRAYQASMQEIGNEYAQVFARGGQRSVEGNSLAQELLNGNVKLGDLQKTLDALQAIGKTVTSTSIDQIKNIAGGGGTDAVAKFLAYIHNVPSTTVSDNTKNETQNSDVQTLAKSKGYDYSKMVADGYTEDEIKQFLNQ